MKKLILFTKASRNLSVCILPKPSKHSALPMSVQKNRRFSQRMIMYVDKLAAPARNNYQPLHNRRSFKGFLFCFFKRTVHTVFWQKNLRNTLYHDDVMLCHFWSRSFNLVSVRHVTATIYVFLRFI